MSRCHNRARRDDPSWAQPRPISYRASCDDCYLAKVKCSKTSPCRRCLQHGHDCRYSPSSRSGKPKSTKTSKADEGSAITGGEVTWPAPEQPMEPAAGFGLAMPGYPSPASAGAAVYSPAPACPPPFDHNTWGTALLTPPYTEASGRLRTPDYAAPTMPAQTALPPAPMAGLPSTSPVDAGNFCTCFQKCAQSLQALDAAATTLTPPFDTILSLNCDALVGCSSMLNCHRCMGRSGTPTAAMLLATVLGRVASFYKSATYTPAGNDNTYPTGGGAHALDLELLFNDLRTLQGVHRRFASVCDILLENTELARVMIADLGGRIDSAVQAVYQWQGMASAAAPRA